MPLKIPFFSEEHSPRCLSVTSLPFSHTSNFIIHSVLYVFPSVPHTGAYSLEHILKHEHLLALVSGSLTHLPKRWHGGWQIKPNSAPCLPVERSRTELPQVNELNVTLTWTTLKQLSQFLFFYLLPRPPRAVSKGFSVLTHFLVQFDWRQHLSPRGHRSSDKQPGVDAHPGIGFSAGHVPGLPPKNQSIN